MFNEKRADSVDFCFQKLCHEAVAACGPDLPAIERYVADRLDAMDEETRARVKYDLERILSYRSPWRSGNAAH